MASIMKATSKPKVLKPNFSRYKNQYEELKRLSKIHSKKHTEKEKEEKDKGHLYKKLLFLGLLLLLGQRLLVCPICFFLLK